jgi:hypothetical protein
MMDRQTAEDALDTISALEARIKQLEEALEAMLSTFSPDLWRKVAAEHGRTLPLEAVVAKARDTLNDGGSRGVGEEGREER